jgi:hypothetical protein
LPAKTRNRFLINDKYKYSLAIPLEYDFDSIEICNVTEDNVVIENGEFGLYSIKSTL